MQISPAIAQRQRLAWIILLLGFATFVIAAVAIPLGINTFLQRARQPMFVAAQANEGTLGLEYANDDFQAIRAGDAPVSLNGGTNVTTTPQDTGLLLLYADEGQNLLTEVQLYGGTSVAITDASTPRFDFSSAPNRLLLNVSSGRIRLRVPDEMEMRLYAFVVTTPHGMVTVDGAGSYSIEVDNQLTQVTVQEGKAVIDAGGAILDLGAAERALFDLSGVLAGPLASERNLIGNGTFAAGLDQWTALSWNIELDNQPEGKIEVQLLDSTARLHMERIGVGHADARIRQVIDQDVTDFESLRLLVTLMIVDQSLNVCGNRGSECPLTIQIDYIDQNGSERTWQQGFFAIGDTGNDAPDVCQFCPPPLNEHEKVAFGQVAFRESGDLLEELRQQGIEVRLIKSVTLVTSGHSFITQVIDIALMATE